MIAPWVAEKVQTIRAMAKIRQLALCPHCDKLLTSVSSFHLYVFRHDLKYWHCKSCSSIYYSPEDANVFYSLGAARDYLKPDHLQQGS